MSKRARQQLIRLAFVAFACRALVPVGFMPAPLADGGPITLCHGGIAGAFFKALAATPRASASAAHDGSAHDHAAHDDSAQGDPNVGDDDHRAHGEEPASTHVAWDHCPVGAAFTHALPTAELAIDVLLLEDAFALAEPSRLVFPLFAASYQARAPPIV